MTPAALAVVAAILLCVCSCSVALTLPRYERSKSGFVHLAGIEGELVLNGRCLMLRTPDGVSHLLVWPDDGATWNALEQTVTVDGVRLQPGQTIIVGGGEFESPVDPDDWVVAPPRECWRERRWLVEFIPAPSETPSPTDAASVQSGTRWSPLTTTPAQP